MAIKRRTKKQAAKERAQLKKLRESGKYRGKIDLRKAATRYQRSLLKRFGRSLRARAKKAARSVGKGVRKVAARIKERFTRKRAPKKEPKLNLGKSNKTQRVGRATIKRKTIRPKQMAKVRRPKNSLTTYALPFKRRGGKTEWRRFTYDQLRAFLAEYVADKDAAAEWKEYAIEETWSFATRDEKNEFRETIEENVFGEDISVNEIQVGEPDEIRRTKDWQIAASEAGLME